LQSRELRVTWRRGARRRGTAARRYDFLGLLSRPRCAERHERSGKTGVHKALPDSRPAGYAFSEAGLLSSQGAGPFAFRRELRWLPARGGGPARPARAPKYVDTAMGITFEQSGPCSSARTRVFSH